MSGIAENNQQILGFMVSLGLPIKNKIPIRMQVCTKGYQSKQILFSACENYVVALTTLLGFKNI